MHTWEVVYTSTDRQVRRFAVPGGWLYQVQHGHYISYDETLPDYLPPVYVKEPTDD